MLNGMESWRVGTAMDSGHSQTFYSAQISFDLPDPARPFLGVLNATLEINDVRSSGNQQLGRHVVRLSCFIEIFDREGCPLVVLPPSFTARINHRKTWMKFRLNVGAFSLATHRCVLRKTIRRLRPARFLVPAEFGPATAD